MTICVVTGSNRGIGLEICRQLKARGDHVIAACRDTSDELESLNIEVVAGIDVADPDSVAALKNAVADRKVGLVFNNAGILRRDDFDSIGHESVADMVDQFRVNSIGPVLVTRALIDSLDPGAKIAIVTSRMGSVTDNNSGGYYGYRMSKAAVNIAGKSLAIDLKGRGVGVYLLHPGYVQTDMTSATADVTPDVSVQGMLARLDELGVENSGSFWHAQGEALPW